VEPHFFQTRLQTVPRPVTLRFADVEAGIVTQHELRKSLHSVQVDTKVVGNSVQVDTKFVGNSTQTPKRTLSPKLLLPTTPVSSTQKEVATSPAETAEGFASTQDHVYKIILLGTTGVGKSSILAVGINGDNAYAVSEAKKKKKKSCRLELCETHSQCRNEEQQH
jgi:Ras-related protein Rab-11A